MSEVKVADWYLIKRGVMLENNENDFAVRQAVGKVWQTRWLLKREKEAFKMFENLWIKEKG